MNDTATTLKRASGARIDDIAEALTEGALPGETDGFNKTARKEAARFVAEAAAERPPGESAIRLESVADESGARILRLAVVNDDMPFIVDSIAATIAAHNLAVLRLLHPIVPVVRDAEGRLVEFASEAKDAKRESVVYTEIERVDARERRELLDDIERVLRDVRCAVADWKRMQARMRADAETIEDAESRALLAWFADNHFTLIGHRIEKIGDVREDGLGIFRVPGPDCWGGTVFDQAVAYFARGGRVPLLAKSDRISTVHRRVPLDLVVVPIRERGEVVALSVFAGLWTSQALTAPAREVPMLRADLKLLEDELGFDPSGHAGKALQHVLSRLPHDILIGFERETLRQVALTAMSLTDRPRAKLLLIPGALTRHLFAFVWLPREELTPERREQIRALLADATDAMVSSWSIELGDGDLAFVRYTLDVAPDAALPDAAALDAAVERMVRGWGPAVEAHLAERGSATRATRLAMDYAPAFPAAYRSQYGAEEAARDVTRLRSLKPEQRGARLYKLAGDPETRLRLKLYRMGDAIPLSDAVPTLENFGFRVLEEFPTPLHEGRLGHIHDFLLEIAGEADLDALLQRAKVKEGAIAAVLEGRAENDEFNQLIIAAGLDPREVTLLRAWFRYLRQTGLSYGLATVVETLREEPRIARALLDLFGALHGPGFQGDREKRAQELNEAIDAGLTQVSAIDDDAILRALRAVVQACLRTNAFAPAAKEALAFKLDSKRIPGLPAPVPWREIWVYSPRVEGIHLRGGPVARGGLRWSDRRDDFRTEILGLMKAQLVKNAVIVPTGAKGGFYPKQLPSPAENRDAWLAEGTEAYRIFIRTLLSVTDNIVGEKVVDPDQVIGDDGDDAYFVVAADKGTASFSDVANAIALDRGFWLGDAFASGGGYGYDHKAMGITAKGAWISVQRHFLEMGIDVQTDPVTVAGCGDMSGDVFGNGMLLSQTLKLIAAFDHRHIFLDPDPDPAASWAERQRMFGLPRSSWEDYDTALISEGGGIYARSLKEIPLSPQVQAMLGVEAATMRPAELISAILRADVDLIWFGGIGTYVKASQESNVDVGDPANDKLRVNGKEIRAKVIGEGANLGCTQAGRIEFAEQGGRMNTDFIDNSAGVDCSDNEVNIKIPLNREMQEGRLGFEDRNALLAEMTDEVGALVLEDNRLQTLALSIAEFEGAHALPSQVRVIEILEGMKRIDRVVEGLGSNEDLLRRAQDGRGLTRPELSVLLAHSKLALQDAVERAKLPDDPTLEPMLMAAFPAPMRERFAKAIEGHRLRREILATKIANLVVNRIGFVGPFELAEEEGVALSQIAVAYIAADQLFALEPLWEAIETTTIAENERLQVFAIARSSVRLHLADLLRSCSTVVMPGEVAAQLGPGVKRLDEAREDLLKDEARLQSSALTARLAEMGLDPELVARIVRLYELDGAIGASALAGRLKVGEVEVTRAYVRLGEALGLDWAKAAAIRFVSRDPWERLLTAGLSRDFEQLRLDFLARTSSKDPVADVDAWLAAHRARVQQFNALIARARLAPS
ncbi:MAG: NAD-glutamate dehydrogenase, partial [Sphingomonadaceae bacterium]|nr:NAD-glutamate dehydrogenase [Sphingomonadaceae bacterium]